MLERVGIAVLVNLAFGGLAHARGAVSRGGWIGGTVVGAVILAAGGWGAWSALVAFFVLGTGATRLGYARKARGGLAQEEGGRRGTRHALANCATGVVLACLMPLWESLAPGLALVAAFATATSDTLGSEIGQLYGRRPVLPTTWRPVPPGTEGAVSVEGTLAGIAGSAVLGAVGWASGLYGPGWIGVVVVAAFAGTSVESYVGAVWGRKAKIGNEAMNFVNTLVGAAVALLAALLAGA